MNSVLTQGKITLALPCYNPREAQWKNLEHFIDAELLQLKECLEILVIDDGSEHWVEPPQSLRSKMQLIRCEKNLGKGAALRLATERMSPESQVFAFLDFDLPYSANDLIGMIQAVRTRGVDACIGDRSMNHGSHRFTREMSHRLFRLCMRMLITGGVPDTQCGIKAYDAQAIRLLAKTASINGFLFDVEWIYIGLRHRMAFRYWPVKILDAHESTPLRSFGLSKLFSQLKTLISKIIEKSYDSPELYAYLEQKRSSLKTQL